MENKELILKLLNEIQLSLASLTDTFSDFSDTNKLPVACSWNAFLVGQISANIETIQKLLKED